jgi:hypothetical protein
MQRFDLHGVNWWNSGAGSQSWIDRGNNMNAILHNWTPGALTALGR